MKRGRERMDMGLPGLFQRPGASTNPPADSTRQCPPNGTSLASPRFVERDQKCLFPVLATSSKHTSTDCVSSTALMVYRGIGAGIAWTVAVDLYELLGHSDRAWKEHLATLPAPSTKRREFSRLLLSACGRNVKMFGGFLMVYGGLTCSMEMVRGRHDFVNPFVGGFCSGLMIMPKDLFKTPKKLAGAALGCATAAMLMHQFFPASSEGRHQEEGGDRRVQAATIRGEI